MKRKEARKQKADERQKRYNAMTTQQKLDALNEGGFTAVKQRAKLVSLLEKEAEIKAAQKVPVLSKAKRR